MGKTDFNCFDPFMPTKMSNAGKNIKMFEAETEITNETSFGFDSLLTSTDKMQVRVPQIKKGFVVVITCCEIGEKNNLGRKLLGDFLMTLSQTIDLPQYVIFLSNSIELIAYDSECISILKAMKKYGIGIVVSMESLEHYGAVNDCKIGQKESTSDIMQKIICAKKLIKI